MTIQTVGELKKELKKYPNDMPLIGYNGSDGDKPISLIPLSAEDRGCDCDDKRPALMISVDY